MDNISFREIVKLEINNVYNKCKDQEDFKKLNTDDNQKSYTFLYWFLNMYYPAQELEDIEVTITEGNGDASCDIIYSNKGKNGEEEFYVIQAKWFKDTNVNKSNQTGTLLKASVTDFDAIIAGTKEESATNEKFNIQYRKLKAHIQENKRVTFIFLPLCKRTLEAEGVINSFKTNHGELIDLKVYDIQKIKEDYIDLNFKEIKTHNPLSTPHEPTNNLEIHLEVKNKVKIQSPDESYIFVVKPSEIHKMFKEYGFSLFFKNIRNPLLKSAYNEDIYNTLIKSPKRFWYYNNGVTAITKEIKPFNNASKKIKVNGIQIINGAQTVFSVYKAYESLSEAKRKKIDKDVYITLRVITSSNIKENTRITKFTNSQNKVIPRDFHSNELVQKKLQREFCKESNIWYETRRGEFRTRLEKKYKVDVVSNELIGQTYLSYYLKKPILAKGNKQSIFLTSTENSKGVYDKIFNNRTNQVDMEISYKLYQFIEAKRKEQKKALNILASKAESDYDAADKLLDSNKYIQSATFNLLAMFNTLFEKVITGNKRAVRSKVLSQLKKDDYGKIKEYYEFLMESNLSFFNTKGENFAPSNYLRVNSSSVKELEDNLTLKLTTEKKVILKL